MRKPPFIVQFFIVVTLFLSYKWERPKCQMSKLIQLKNHIFCNRKYQCMADLLFYWFRFSSFALIEFNKRFTFLVKSKPVKQEVSRTEELPVTKWAVWPDWAILLDFGQLFKAFATINLPKSPTFLGNFCKGVKIYHFSSEIIFRQLLPTFGDFFLVTLLHNDRLSITTGGPIILLSILILPFGPFTTIKIYPISKIVQNYWALNS